MASPTGRRFDRAALERAAVVRPRDATRVATIVERVVAVTPAGASGSLVVTVAGGAPLRADLRRVVEARLPLRLRLRDRTALQGMRRGLGSSVASVEVRWEPAAGPEHVRVELSPPPRFQSRQDESAPIA